MRFPEAVTERRVATEASAGNILRCIMYRNDLKTGVAMRSVSVLCSLMIVILAAAAGCSTNGSTPAPRNGTASDPPSPEELARGGNLFAMELYGMVSSGEAQQNVFFSPLSISSALAMTYAGARGETALQMDRVMHYGTPPEGIAEAYGPFMASLGSGRSSDPGEGEPLTLSVANGLWVQEGFALLEDFTREMEDSFDAALENLDFENDEEGARRRINGWVAERTMDRITDLIAPGLLTPETRVVLTNAVYFKASWDMPFEESLTGDGRFLLRDGGAVEVPMMRQTDYFRFVATEGCRAVELPYAGGSASMLVLLPDGDIMDFQERLDADLVRTLRNRMSTVNLALTMPRFEYSATIQLGPVLRSMGMEAPFTHAADFSGFTGGPDLFISEVVHKAFVKVDESGTEAAAATAVVMNLTAMPVQPEEMNVNRPFIFLIMDSETDAVLFMGRVMDPSV